MIRPCYFGDTMLSGRPEHRNVLFTVTVVITRSRQIFGKPKNIIRNSAVSAVEDIPNTRGRTVDGNICLSVSVIISRCDLIGTKAEKGSIQPRL